REDQDVAVRGMDLGQHPVGTGADLLHGLALRPRPGPDRPARVVLADLRGETALESAVVPLTQVGLDDRDALEAGESGGLRCARERTREDETEPGARQASAECARLLPTRVGQGDIGPAGVASETRAI